ncbi:unnamed protein product [Effrenium voratum]|nr:unnamed protein product [Effrenium voratum]
MAWREIEDLTGESFSRRTAQSQRISVICPSTEERIMFHPQLYECFAAQTYHDKEGWTEVDARMDSSTGHFRQLVAESVSARGRAGSGGGRLALTPS